MGRKSLTPSPFRAWINHVRGMYQPLSFWEVLDGWQYEYSETVTNYSGQFLDEEKITKSQFRRGNKVKEVHQRIRNGALMSSLAVTRSTADQAVQEVS